MPTKRGGVITPAGAHLMTKDAGTRKLGIACHQIEAGDRVDDPRMRNPSRTDVRIGLPQAQCRGWEQIHAVVKDLVAAATARCAFSRSCYQVSASVPLHVAQSTSRLAGCDRRDRRVLCLCKTGR